jgi:integrase
MTPTSGAPNPWEKIEHVPGLLRYNPSGTYFWRGRIFGKIFTRTLKTNRLAEARAAIPDLIARLRESHPDPDRELPRAPRGYLPADTRTAKMGVSVNLGQLDKVSKNRRTKWSEAAAIVVDTILADPLLAARTKSLHTASIRRILVEWSDLAPRRIDELPESAIRAFFAGLAARYSRSTANSWLWLFRAITACQIDRDMSLGYPLALNPADKIKPWGIVAAEVKLPEMGEWQRLIDWLDDHAPEAARTTRALAYTGARVSEARQLTWGDIDLERRRVRIFNSKRRAGSSKATHRLVPLIPDAVEFFTYWKKLTTPHPTTRVIADRRCDREYAEACAALSIPRINHHAFRHFFATRCIEAGVDIPTVARWLGHSDGGVLAMKVYGHLRDNHSQEMALKIQRGESHSYRGNDTVIKTSVVLDPDTEHSI